MTTGLTRRHLLQLLGVGAVGATALGAVPALSSPAAAAQRIIPRAEWGFDGWIRGGPPAMDRSGLTDFIVHFHGAENAVMQGVEAPRIVHRTAKQTKDSSGFAYNYLITQAGEVYEGRGLDFRSAATHGANEHSIAVQMHIYGDMEPSADALASLDWLYRECHRMLRSDIGAALRINGHQDHSATDCPGRPLAAWIDGPGQELYRSVAAEMGGQPTDPEPTPEEPAPQEPTPEDPPAGTPPYPGANAFHIGQRHPAVRTLDEGLVKKGFARHHDGDGYQPGEKFTEHTRLNVQDFQRAQGWSGSGADGYPGPQTWQRLVG